MKKLVFTLCVLFLSMPAHAQNQAAFCKLWFTHKNSAAYMPGVDVHGKPVVPADVNSAAMRSVAESVRIPITVDLAQQLDQQLPAGTELNANAGMVEIFQNGRVFFNGADVTNDTISVCAGDAEQVVAVNSDVPQMITEPVITKNDEVPPSVSENSEEVSMSEDSGDDQIIWGQDY